MKSYKEMLDKRLALSEKFKELKKEIDEYGFIDTELERIFNVYVVSYMALIIEGSVNTNAMKVHNDFNAYKKYSLNRFKKEYGYLKKYLKDDAFYINKFTDFFEIVNLNKLGRQKNLSRKNLERSLSRLHEITKNMYQL